MDQTLASLQSAAPDGRSQRADAVGPQAYLVVSAVFHYLGPSLAVLLVARAYVTDQLAMARLPRARYATTVALLPALAIIIGVVILAQIPTAVQTTGGRRWST